MVIATASTVGLEVLSAEQIQALSLSFTGHHVVNGTSGSGKTTVAVMRALAGTLSSDLGAAKPTIIVPALLRGVRARDLAAEHGNRVLIQTFASWLRGVAAQAHLDKEVDVVHPSNVVIEAVKRGVYKSEPVCVDDFQDLNLEQITAIRLFCPNAVFFGTMKKVPSSEQRIRLDTIDPIEQVHLTANFRNTPEIVALCDYFANIQLRNYPLASLSSAAATAMRLSNSGLANFVVRAWLKDKLRRVAVLTTSIESVTSLANSVMDTRTKGLLVRATDVGLRQIDKWTLDAAGVYIMPAWQASGLEFEHVILAGAENIGGDLSSVTNQKVILSSIQAATESMTITWSNSPAAPAWIANTPRKLLRILD